jgi:hypothetical protein
MGRNFAFKGHTRTIARALVDTMMPRWPELETDLTERVLDDVESVVRNFPVAFQAGYVAGLWALEAASPLLGGGPRPFSRCDLETRERRLRALQDSKVPQLRQVLLLYGVFVTASAYGQPEVEAFLGVPRRAWRDARALFRERLVQLESSRPLRPATPEALGSHGVARPEAYLDEGTLVADELRAVGE